MERTLEGRIKSFAKSKNAKSTSSKAAPGLAWPHPDSYAATPQTLAEAGFYFSPDKSDPDNVRCFMCEKELGGWDKDDNPFEIHISKSPKCPWAIARCSLEFDMDADGNFSIKNPARIPSNKLLEKARLDTYGGKQKWWPHDSDKNHGATSKKMAKAGFVYTPQVPGDDTATCLYCDLSLSGWDAEDDPAEEHRKREKRSGKPCPFFHAKVQIAPSGSKAASRKSKAAPKLTEVVTEDSEVDMTDPASRKKGKQKSMAPPSTIPSSSIRKTAAKSHTSHDEESQDEGLGGSKSSRKGGKAKSVAKGKIALDMVSEVEEEAVPNPPRSKTPASKKASTSEKPPSNVNGKVSKQQQEQDFADVVIGLNDEEERGGRSKDTGLSQSTSSRKSKSKPRSTAGASKPSSSRSRSRAASRTRADNAEGGRDAEEDDDNEPVEEPDPAPAPKPKAKRQTKGKPITAIEDSDLEAILAPKSKTKKQTKAATTSTTKKADETDVDDAVMTVESPKLNPQTKKPAPLAGSRAQSENPPSTVAMDVDEDTSELQPQQKTARAPKKPVSAKKGGGLKSSLSSSSSSSARAASKSATSRTAQRENVDGGDERLATLEEDVHEMQVDNDEAPSVKPASSKAVKEKTKTKAKTKAKPEAVTLEEVAETDESAPPSRPASSAASVRNIITPSNVPASETVAAPQAKPVSKPNGKTKAKAKATDAGQTERPHAHAAEVEKTMDVDVDASDGTTTTTKKKKTSPPVDAPPMLQPAAKIRNDKFGYRPATPGRQLPDVVLTLTSPSASSPTRPAPPPPKAPLALPEADGDELLYPPTPAPAPDSTSGPDPNPPPTPTTNGTAIPIIEPDADADADANSRTSTNRLALFVPPLARAPLELAQALTDAERALTVEQWIRHEMDVQYAALERDGARRIAAFREAAEEARRQIEAL